jgi:transposase
METLLKQYENHPKETLLLVVSDLIVENENLLSKASEFEIEKSELESKKSELESQVNYLKFQLEQLKRMIFGSKSERFIAANNPEQLQLPFEVDAQEVAQAAEVAIEQIVYNREKKTKKSHPGRMALPTHLPVNEIVLEPKEDVSQMKFIGNEITDELDYVPGKLEINRYIRPKYITPENKDLKQEVKIASLDFRPIDKCIAGANLLAQIVIDKHIDHLPVYRQLQRFAREEVVISTSTIESWQRLLAELLLPLYQRQKQYALKNGYLQVDESTIKVQDRSKKGTTHQGYMWVYRAPIPEIVYFEYQKGRGKEFPQANLNEFTGYLQTDAYAGYDQIGLRQNVVALGCWAHARRNFEKALNYNKEKATVVLLKIQQLYAIEREAKEETLDFVQRHALRLEKALPILNELGQYIYAQSKLETPQSPLGKAYSYCTNRWDAFLNYLKDGILEIDVSAPPITYFAF